MAERLALARSVERDVVRAAGEAEPAHAVRQARGSEPDLGVAVAFADLTEHGVVADPAVLEYDLAVSAGKAAIHRIR